MSRDQDPAQLLRTLWADSTVSIGQIARKLDCTRSAARRRASRLGLPPRDSGEIVQALQEAGWTHERTELLKTLWTDPKVSLTRIMARLKCTSRVSLWQGRPDGPSPERRQGQSRPQEPPRHALAG
jgi:hypothetical protein